MMSPLNYRLPAPWTRTLVALVAAIVLAGSVAVCVQLSVLSELHYLYFNREALPDLGSFTRFEFPSIGHVYDRNGEPLIEMAHEYRHITQFADIPAVVLGAMLAAEDKRFFSHSGLDYLSLPRVAFKIRLNAWAARTATGGRRDNMSGRAIFPQGGSTITQQLVRGVFLQRQTSQENSYQLRSSSVLSRVLSTTVGARNANMVLRKREEIRLSLWLEQQMRDQFGSKRRAKEEILARYATFVYMGNGQYGFERAAEYYFGRPLSTFTVADADKAAILAGIAKAPRDYAPTATNRAAILRRRNQILALMASAKVLSADNLARALAQPLPAVVPYAAQAFRSSAVIEHVLDELTAAHPGLTVDDLLQGYVQVHSTVDARLQRIVNEALERGLEAYQARHPRAVGVVQGSVVVLDNRDGSVLAEVGGRQTYRGRTTSYSDFNRVRQAMRQPGSAMKPIVYLAAFNTGVFDLETLVPDEPISVPDRDPDVPKWIANYDGKFKGLIPVRKALAESRNAVAIWITKKIGIGAVLRTSRQLGVHTTLQPFATTALGASEVSLIELATAYRTIATGVLVEPFVIRQVDRGGEGIAGPAHTGANVAINRDVLALIQEGLRGVVRIPSGTAHALDARSFPIAVMGKTGTTNDFRDALFVGSTFGRDGITVAVRIGYDDNRTLGARETGGRVALPVFREVMLNVYRDRIVGATPVFPVLIEEHITHYLQGDHAAPVVSDGAGGLRAAGMRAPVPE